MAFLTCRFFSEALATGVAVNVLLPQPTQAQIGMKGVAVAEEAPVLYLLHGISDDESTWMRRTSIERYAAAAGLAVVMPGCGRSFYADLLHGPKYWTYLSEELPRVMHSFFRFSTRREDTFVAGLSMGGYGAMKLALRHPERFAAAASFSGALDPLHLKALWKPHYDAEFADIFGDEARFLGSDNDLFALAERRADEKTALPRLFLTCGTEDALLSDTRRFRDHLARLGIEYAYDDCPGVHEWGLWDRKVSEAIEWFGKPRQ